MAPILVLILYKSPKHHFWVPNVLVTRDLRFYQTSINFDINYIWYVPMLVDFSFMKEPFVSNLTFKKVLVNFLSTSLNSILQIFKPIIFVWQKKSKIQEPLSLIHKQHMIPCTHYRLPKVGNFIGTKFDKLNLQIVNVPSFTTN
jgi:hypothetical protein